MNNINPKKLLNSKWTAIKPLSTESTHKEKHFLVTRVDYSHSGKVSYCDMEAVISKHTVVVDWRSLGNDGQWHQGWL